MSRIEWDPIKAEGNFRKHCVAFNEAETVLADRLSVHRFDPTHSWTEPRFVAVGTSPAGHVLFVTYTDDGSSIRLISARHATKRERHEYERS